MLKFGRKKLSNEEEVQTLLTYLEAKFPNAKPMHHSWDEDKITIMGGFQRNSTMIRAYLRE